jgi:hypothetical protein
MGLRVCRCGFGRLEVFCVLRVLDFCLNPTLAVSTHRTFARSDGFRFSVCSKRSCLMYVPLFLEQRTASQRMTSCVR